MTDKPSLRTAIREGRFVVAPGLHDMMTVRIANRIGFDFVYASGYWLTASHLGLPDAGIATYSQMLDRVAKLSELSTGAVIADADTGYGGLLNVHHTVRGYEAAGVRGIQIEDQEFPKKCGHTPGKRVVPLAEAVRRLAVAAEARRNPEETLIIARTDARQAEGFDAALARAKAYAEVADIVFFEAPTSVDEMKRVAEAIDKPLLANMAEGGVTPILTADELKALGHAVAIFPALTALPAAAAAEASLRVLKETGGARGGPARMDFREMCRIMGFEEVWEFDRRWASDD